MKEELREIIDVVAKQFTAQYGVCGERFKNIESSQTAIGETLKEIAKAQAQHAVTMAEFKAQLLNGYSSRLALAEQDILKVESAAQARLDGIVAAFDKEREAMVKTYTAERNQLNKRITRILAVGVSLLVSSIGTLLYFVIRGAASGGAVG